MKYVIVYGINYWFWICDRYACPLCSKSVCDMSKVWEKYDMEIAATPMPEPYQNKLVSLSFNLFLHIGQKEQYTEGCILSQVWILCNDCGKTSEVPFHLVAQKCLNCKSYNTRQIRGWESGGCLQQSSNGVNQPSLHARVCLTFGHLAIPYQPSVDRAIGHCGPAACSVLGSQHHTHFPVSFACFLLLIFSLTCPVPFVGTCLTTRLL